MRSLSNIASDATHEVLHTLRLGHPFELTQTADTELVRVAPNSFVSTSTTDKNIVNNIMNYPQITIDGMKGYDLNMLTKGQLNYILNEINLQKRGYGFAPKHNSVLTPEQNANLYKQYYEDYLIFLQKDILSRYELSKLLSFCIGATLLLKVLNKSPLRHFLFVPLHQIRV